MTGCFVSQVSTTVRSMSPATGDRPLMGGLVMRREVWAWIDAPHKSEARYPHRYEERLKRNTGPT